MTLDRRTPIAADLAAGLSSRVLARTSPSKGAREHQKSQFARLSQPVRYKGGENMNRKISGISMAKIALVAGTALVVPSMAVAQNLSLIHI